MVINELGQIREVAKAMSMKRGGVLNEDKARDQAHGNRVPANLPQF